MCEICESMLAAEHKPQSGAALCPKCLRFPLDAQVAIDPSQWDYVAPELRNPTQSIAPQPTPILPDLTAVQPLESLEDLISDETNATEEPDEHVRTCYHCYQIGSGLGERCPVCGDSYLPAAMRKPYSA
jgi:hypothetical protein